MGRHRRPYLPAAIFHLTARTLREERLFTPPVKTGAYEDLATVAPASKCRILAVAIMSNHLHLVVQQGESALERLMQPFLRRVALRTQRAHGRAGPVFWRPYSEVACLDPWHARNAIVYTHLNPVRAGMREDPARYPWTSHELYARTPQDRSGHAAVLRCAVIESDLGLPLFAAGRNRSAEELTEDYRAAVEWRLAMDRLGVDPDPAADEHELPDRPAAAWEGGSWSAVLSPLFHTPAHLAAAAHSPVSPAPDMTAIAHAVLASEAPEVSLDLIRRPGHGRRRSHLRHAIIRRLHAAGYRNYQIARFLGLAESTVSNVIRRSRPGVAN